MSHFRVRFVSLAALAGLSFLAADWQRFRGPGGNATSDETGLPGEWSAEQHIVWKTALPGFGAACPITSGDRIYLACYSGYGAGEEGEQADLLRHVVCLNRADGAILWDTPLESALPEEEYQGFVALHGYASHTPVTDGEHVYAFFGKSGVFCLDLDGRQVWHADVGTSTHGFGTAPSPVLHGDLVIVNASVESGALVGLNKRTGAEVWRRGGVSSAWNTPILVEVAGGPTELVIAQSGALAAYNPENGEPLWTCAGANDYICPSPISHEGVVYAVLGRGGICLAVRAGGRGDVTETHRLWQMQLSSNVPSPVFYDGHLYCVSDSAIAHCVRAEDGEHIYEERLEGAGTVYASLTAVDGKLYCPTRQDGTFVLAARPEFEVLSQNVLEGDESIFNASVVVNDGRLLLRSDRFMYCIGE